MDESIVKHLEQPQVGTLKLSEAIRIGAGMRPQTRGSAFDDAGSCALGAAYEGRTGGTCAYNDIEKQYAVVPEVFHVPGRYNNLGWAITSKNDHGESRESIADWLEGQGY